MMKLYIVVGRLNHITSLLENFHYNARHFVPKFICSSVDDFEIELTIMLSLVVIHCANHDKVLVNSMIEFIQKWPSFVVSAMLNNK